MGLNLNKRLQVSKNWKLFEKHYFKKITGFENVRLMITMITLNYRFD